MAAEHRPTSLDGATSTHMVMYVTSRCGLELSFFLPTPAWLAGRTSSLKSPRSLRGKTSWRNFWLSQPRRAGGTSVIRSSKSYVTLSCDLGWQCMHCIACACGAIFSLFFQFRMLKMRKSKSKQQTGRRGEEGEVLVLPQTQNVARRALRVRRSLSQRPNTWHRRQSFSQRTGGCLYQRPELCAPLS